MCYASFYKRQIKTSRKTPQEDFLSHFESILPPNGKWAKIRRICWSKTSLISPLSAQKNAGNLVEMVYSALEN